MAKTEKDAARPEARLPKGFRDIEAAEIRENLEMAAFNQRKDRASMERQLAKVLEGYERFRALDRRELHLVEALRTLRLIHYSAWIAERWDDPAFPAAFPWFGTTRYWQDRILELREQIGAMAEPPLALP